MAQQGAAAAALAEIGVEGDADFSLLLEDATAMQLAAQRSGLKAMAFIKIKRAFARPGGG